MVINNQTKILNLIQCLAEVVDDVVGMLGADGETDCALEDALVGEFCFRELRVSGRSRMDYERLYVGYVGK